MPLEFSIKLIKVNLPTGKLIKFLDMNGVHIIFSDSIQIQIDKKIDIKSTLGAC